MADPGLQPMHLSETCFSRMFCTTEPLLKSVQGRPILGVEGPDHRAHLLDLLLLPSFLGGWGPGLLGGISDGESRVWPAVGGRCWRLLLAGQGRAGTGNSVTWTV